MFEKAYKIVEIGLNEFQLVEKIISESGLILDGFLGGDESIPLLKYKLQRNQCKVFIVRNELEIVSFVVLLSKRNIVSKLSYDWHIAYLFVSEKCRRLGLGEYLLDYTIQFAINTRAKVLSLYADKNNSSAVQLYRKVGFKETIFLSKYLNFTLLLDDFR